MTMEAKGKASRNKTLTIEENEILSLRQEIVYQDEVKEGMDYKDKIICDDVINVLSCLPDGFADLIIIDPPYNLSRNFGTVKFEAMKEDVYEEYLMSWFPEVCRKLSPKGSLYMCGDWKCTSSMQRVIARCLKVINRITWQREKGRGTKANWKNSMEDIWYAVRDEKNYHYDVEAVMMRRKVLAPYRENGQAKDWEECDGGKYRNTHPSNFWDDISIPFWSMKENTPHPTQKPEKLYAKLILASSRKGDIVFDPFAGSGTSAVVARKLGRHYCGIEIDENYCLYAAKRIKNAAMDSSIQGYVGGVFWERNSKEEQIKNNNNK